MSADLSTLLSQAADALDAECHGEDCVLRCLRNDCDADHACDACGDEVIPTCDICNEPDPDGGPDWNGETGCHISCEQERAVADGKLVHKLHHPYELVRAHSVIGPAGVVTLTWRFYPKRSRRYRGGESLFVFDGDYYAEDLGIHSTQPVEYATGNAHCEYTGTTCWYDGTSLGAQRVAKLYLAEGEEALYAELEERYRQRFAKAA